MAKIQGFLHILRYSFVALCVMFSSHSAWADVVVYLDYGLMGFGTSIVYPYNGNVYLDANHTQQMATGSSGANPITKPDISGWTFLGYYDSASSTATSKQYISKYGRITSYGKTAANSYTENTWWYARFSMECAAGTYYNKTNHNCQTCPAGYYCPSKTTVYMNETYSDDQGKVACNTGSLSGFTSPTGATSVQQCYKTGTTTCAVANPISASGNLTGATYATSGSVNCKTYLTAAGTSSNTCIIDTASQCFITGASCADNYQSTISGSQLTSLYQSYSSDSPTSYPSVPLTGASGASTMWAGQFDLQFNYGNVYGQAMCTSSSGTIGAFSEFSSNTGQYCWCTVKKFRTSGSGGLNLPVVSNGGVYVSNGGSLASCQSSCANNCALYLRDNTSSARTNLFGNSSNTIQYTCTPKTYTITLDFATNGGTGGTSSVKEVYATKWTNASGTEIPKVPNLPEKTGSVFTGYYTAASGGTQKIPASGTLPSNTTFTANATLKAQFATCTCTPGTNVKSCSFHSVTEDNKCHFTYVCNDGYNAGAYGISGNSDSNGEFSGAVAVGTNSSPACSGNLITLRYNTGNLGAGVSPSNWPPYPPSCTYGTSFDSTPTQQVTATGHTLSKWQGSGGQWTVGDQIPCTKAALGVDNGDAYLTAIWTPNTYTVTYNSNKPDGVSGNVTGNTADSSHTYGIMKNLTNNGFGLPGYAFKGWNTAADGTGTFYTDGQSVLNLTATNGGTVTLYAIWEQGKFTLTTSSTTSFQFKISAAGEFYVDCGHGGTLSSTANDVAGNMITRSDTTAVTYTCTWQNATTQTIQFVGSATGYSTDTKTAAIGFNITTAENDANALLVTGISGSLGAIFGTVETASTGTTIPRFYNTFYSCINLASTIPSTLFSGVTGTISYMFARTFMYCDNLTGSIPETLFAGIHGTPKSNMFNRTFMGCGKLTGAIPKNLFCQNPTSPNASNCIYGAPASAMYTFTFYSCSGLTGAIPAELFAGLSGAPADSMFARMFYGCSNLDGISNGATTTNYVPSTFLSAIQDGDATNPTDYMFGSTGLPTACPAGTYTVTRSLFNDAKRPLCSVCGANTYNESTGASSCESCLSGYTTSGTFASAHDQQKDCTTNITLNGNGGTGSLPGDGWIICEQGESCNFGVPNLTATTGYTFTGWGTRSDCDSTETEFLNPTGTYYACKSLVSYDIQYYPKGTHTGDKPSSATYGEVFHVSKPTRDGWTFVGWTINTGDDATTHEYSANGTSFKTTNATEIVLTLPAYQYFKNLRSTPGTVRFIASWSILCPAGTYYNDTNKSCDTCPGNGKFCPGTSGILDSGQNAGLQDCPSGYTSDTGATSQRMCYKTGSYNISCALANNSIVVPTHSTGMAFGTASPNSVACKKYYDYNNSNPTCFPSSAGICDLTGLTCDTGYSSANKDQSYITTAFTSAGTSVTGIELDGTAVTFGDNPNNSSYISRNGNANGEYNVVFANGTVHGRAMCSSTSGTVGNTGLPYISEGNYCWCKITRVKNSSSQWLPITSNWVNASSTFSSAAACKSSCAYTCASAIKSHVPATQGGDASVAGAALFNSANQHQYECAANKINIIWQDVGAGAMFGNVSAVIAADNTSTVEVSYGDDIVTPSVALQKTGMVFLGWRFSSTAN